MTPISEVSRPLVAPVLIERARLARLKVDGLKAKVTAERERLAELRALMRDQDAERERLRDDEERDAALRLLDGDAAAPPKTRRRNRLAKLDEEAPALTAAIAQQQARVAQAECAL